MAKVVAAWGIDIGRCALKALRCRIDGENVVADGFDYIEYPKLLTQPEADAPQLVKEALEQFLSRNSVRGDKVAVSVAGETGLARYFKPPPVDQKKMPDIVKYEARQQIPFALEDVIWDYQRMPGAKEVDGFVLESEIGLFAMKREQVYKALSPFQQAGIETDVIQLAPIALYNFASYDLTKRFTEVEEYDSESPPPSIVILSIGTDTSDLVVTNGYRVWQRNIPIGGNHFTKQLSKDLRLTFAKAEHLKRNPKQSDDPKTIFTAMRPVFSDLVTEVQRSIGFFSSLDRKAKITHMLMLGNTTKLPGLSQYLGKHLGYEMIELPAFEQLTGSAVVTSPSFKDNLLTFGTCYGLCLQGLEKSKIGTNLLPVEIKTERMIRAKKPWAVATVGALMLACAFNYIFHFGVWNEVHAERKANDVSWKEATDQADAVAKRSSDFKSKDGAKVAQLTQLQKIGHEVIGAADRRILWLEMLKALNESLPRAVEAKGGVAPDPRQLPFDQQQALHIEYIENEYFADLKTWWSNKLVEQKYKELQTALHDPNAAEIPPADAAPPANGAQPGPMGQAPMGQAPMGQAAPADPMAQQPMGQTPMPPAAPMGPAPAAPAPAAPKAGGAPDPGPSGPGWVIEISGYHFFNAKKESSGSAHLRRTLLRHLDSGTIELPGEQGEPPVEFTMKELGIGYPILAYDPYLVDVTIPNPYAEPDAMGGASGAAMPMGFAAPMGFGAPMGTRPGDAKGKDKAKEDEAKNPRQFKARQYKFRVQFCWQERPLTERLEKREKEAKDQAGKAGAVATTP